MEVEAPSALITFHTGPVSRTIGEVVPLTSPAAPRSGQGDMESVRDGNNYLTVSADSGWT